MNVHFAGLTVTGITSDQGLKSSTEVLIKRDGHLLQRIRFPQESGVGPRWIRFINEAPKASQIPIVFLLHDPTAQSGFQPILYVDNQGDRHWVIRQDLVSGGYAGVNGDFDTANYEAGTIVGVRGFDVPGNASLDSTNTRYYLVAAAPCGPGPELDMVLEYAGRSEAEGAGAGRRPHLGDYLQWNTYPNSSRISRFRVQSHIDCPGGE